MCISKKIKRHSPSEIGLQIISLLAHEVVHGLGFEEKANGKHYFSEAEALEIQSFIFEFDHLAFIDSNFYNEFFEIAENSMLEVATLAHHWSKVNDDKFSCFLFEQVQESVDDFILAYTNGSNRIMHFPYGDKDLNLGLDFEVRLSSLYYSCSEISGSPIGDVIKGTKIRDLIELYYELRHTIFRMKRYAQSVRSIGAIGNKKIDFGKISRSKPSRITGEGIEYENTRISKIIIDLVELYLATEGDDSHSGVRCTFAKNGTSVHSEEVFFNALGGGLWSGVLLNQAEFSTHSIYLETADIIYIDPYLEKKFFFSSKGGFFLRMTKRADFDGGVKISLNLSLPTLIYKPNNIPDDLRSIQYAKET